MQVDIVGGGVCKKKIRESKLMSSEQASSLAICLCLSRLNQGAEARGRRKDDVDGADAMALTSVSALREP
jgi:hypothetical protein